MNSATILYLVCAVVGCGLLCAGVFLLAGVGWALIAGAASCFAAAGFIRRGLTSA